MSSAPTVTGIDPNSGVAAGGTSVTITGTGFVGATGVNFGVTKSPNFTVVNDAQILAVSPSGSGMVDVSVLSPNGTSSLSTNDRFTYAQSGGGQSGGGGGYYIDPGLSSELVGSLLNILQTATSPDALEAQNIILRRMALEGDIVGSRVPPPRNITEIGGYINLLDTLNQPDMRSQALAGILGVAGPSQPLGWINNNLPLSFVSLTNDRPAGPAQPSIPLTFLVRSDFSGALSKGLQSLHKQGCTLPIASRIVMTLPPSQPGAIAPSDVLPYLGRTLDLVVGAALVNPQTDPLALVRTQGSTDPFQVASNSLNPSSVAVPLANYDALQCNSTSCSTVAIANGAFVYVAPVLASAGFYPASPPPQPTSLTSTGWAHFTNISGLVSGVTQLGDELGLLYNWGDVLNSVFAGMLSWVWNGTQFAQP